MFYEHGQVMLDYCDDDTCNKRWPGLLLIVTTWDEERCRTRMVSHNTPNGTGPVAYPADDDTDEANGGFYIYRHGDIPTGVLKLAGREDGSFELSWGGTCNIHDEDPYASVVPFEVAARVSFEGITVLGSERDDADCMRERLANQLPPRAGSRGKRTRGRVLARVHAAPNSQSPAWREPYAR